MLTEDDDFFDEMPTIVLIRRLIEDAIAEAQPDEEPTCELDPAEFCAIGTR